MESKKKDSSKQSTDSVKASRRKFLATGAAAAAFGAVQTTAGQTAGPETKSLKDLIAYGERSQYVKSVRVAVDERPSPDEFGLTFHVLSPLQEPGGNYYAVGAALSRDAPRLDRAEYRSQTAQAVDSRHGGPPARIQHG